MSVSLRLAGPNDGTVVAELFNDLFAHYYDQGAPAPEAVERYVRDTVMTAGTACEIVLAEVASKAVGIATFSVNHPGPDLRGQLTLKDLYVRRGERGQEIGPRILCYLSRLALARNCSRVDWTAETTNPRALAFYDRLDVRRETEKIYYRLDGDDLVAMANRHKVDKVD